MNSTPRRSHSKSGQVLCPICSPCRCRLADRPRRQKPSSAPTVLYRVMLAKGVPRVYVAKAYAEGTDLHKTRSGGPRVVRLHDPMDPTAFSWYVTLPCASVRKSQDEAIDAYVADMKRFKIREWKKHVEQAEALRAVPVTLEEWLRRHDFVETPTGWVRDDIVVRRLSHGQVHFRCPDGTASGDPRALLRVFLSVARS